MFNIFMSIYPLCASHFPSSFLYKLWEELLQQENRSPQSLETCILCRIREGLSYSALSPAHLLTHTSYLSFNYENGKETHHP